MDSERKNHGLLYENEQRAEPPGGLTGTLQPAELGSSSLPATENDRSAGWDNETPSG